MASVDAPMFSDEFGAERSGWGSKGQVVRNGIPVTNNAADAVITIPAAQATAISIQFNNADGSAIAHSQRFELWVVAATTDLTLATTGGSTGMAIGANGKIADTMVPKKVFLCSTDAAGLWKGTWTDNASEAAYLAVIAPSGRAIYSAVLPIT